VAFRYPGEPEIPTLEDARSALRLAQMAVQAVLEKLPAEIRERVDQQHK